jgi:undecaprenyl-phosphate 4-deoxy-4-formamido-L-arabinose transferase
MSVESISVVIPVYNSEIILRQLLMRLHAVLAARRHAFEIILVNDGSSDHSWDAIAKLTEISTQVRGIDLARNCGQHNALLCGIREARYSLVVTLDDDLQHPPEEIPRLLERLAEGYDVVYGTPCQEQHGWWRDGASVVTKLALRHFMGATTSRQVSAFRVFRSHLRDAFANYRSPFVSIDVLLTWGTTRFTAVPVRHEPRRVGRSNYNLRKLLVHALNMTTGFSTLPLRLASLVGFSFTLFGLAVLGWVIGRYVFQGNSVAGFPFLASIIAVFSGTQLFALGIMGEYLARMHDRVMERPAYTVRASLPSNNCDCVNRPFAA